jgi:hypothetical protein
MVESDYAVISPVWAWNVRKELELPGKVRIEQLPESEKPKFKDWNECLSGRQITDLSRTAFWFRYDFRDESIKQTELQSNAKELVRNAVLAYQVARPVGTDAEGSFVVLCKKKDESLVIESVDVYRRLEPTRWGRMIVPEPIDVTAFTAIAVGVQEAFQKKIVRLQNPLYLLELGEEANNPHVRILLWVTALDALVMAGNPKAFERRMHNLLGRKTFVFPAMVYLPQPKYTLGDVVCDLYELRSEIAHGRKIRDGFRKEVGFQDVDGNQIDGYEHSYLRRQILEEAALFLLCLALRTVFTNNLTDVVADAGRWREHLERSDP